MPKQYWLMKSEPDVFSFTDLLKAKGKRTCWDGVRNYQARNFMRDQMKKGDGVLFYHSNAKPPGIAGIAEVVKEGYPDHTQFDPKDSHFDPKSDPESRLHSMVSRATETAGNQACGLCLYECAADHPAIVTAPVTALSGGAS